MKNGNVDGNAQEIVPQSSARHMVSVTIEIRDDHAALMRGVAGYHDKPLEQWITEAAYSIMEADLQGATDDIKAHNECADSKGGVT